METPTMRIRTVVMAAAGRDFHNFNVLYRDDPATEVVAFTAAQIPGIGGRRYPPSLSGALYPDGIPIRDELDLEAVCRDSAVDRVVFAYSDVPHAAVMNAASRGLAAGADFVLAGPKRTMLTSERPVISVTAVRTGCGNSSTARWVSRRLRDRSIRIGVLRHPMPHGDLENPPRPALRTPRRSGYAGVRQRGTRGVRALYRRRGRDILRCGLCRHPRPRRGRG